MDEIELARQMYQLSTEELFEMVTTRSAGVLRLTDGEGTIRQGGAADLVIVEDRGQTPAEALQQMRPEMVMVRGKVRLVSPRLRDKVTVFDDSEWNPISVEGKGTWFTDVNMPAIHEKTVRALGSEYRLAGRRVSL